MLAVIVVLFLIGTAAFAASFFIKEKDKKEYNTHSDEYLEQMLEERLNQVEHRLGQSAKMSASSIKKQTEKELEQLSREKMSAVDEYSDQVMDRINKNHSEVMFLYGLLSDKQKELDETVESLNNAQRELQLSNRINIQKNNADKSVESSNKNSVNKNNSEDIIHDKEFDVNDYSEDVDKRTAINALAKAGVEDVEIAKRLSMGVGEVRLFLELGKGV